MKNKLTILVTGATDGIGLETAKKLNSLGHNILVHGRNSEKLAKLAEELGVDTYRADLSHLSEVEQFADKVLKTHQHIDVLINNAGVFKVAQPITEDGYDMRFMVNCIAPYHLTRKLLPAMSASGRIINLSSAAQSPVDIDALLGNKELEEFQAYAQSKLAITMWSRYLANETETEGPAVIAVNPGSLLGTKMVKEGFGTKGNDINIGVRILTQLSLENQYADASGKYYDNDSGQFSSPQADALDTGKTTDVVQAIEQVIAKYEASRKI